MVQSPTSDKKVYFHPNLNKLIETMNTMPSSSDEKAMKTWAEIGPFQLAQHIIKGRIKIDPELPIKQIETKWGTYFGQVDEHDQPFGIGRHVANKFQGRIVEGTWLGTQLHGFGRVIQTRDSNAKYSEGEYKQNYLEGLGKAVYDDGTVKNGEWKNHKLVKQMAFTF